MPTSRVFELMNYNDLINANSGSINGNTSRVSQNFNSIKPRESNPLTNIISDFSPIIEKPENSDTRRSIDVPEYKPSPALETIILQARRELWEERKRLFTWSGAQPSPTNQNPTHTSPTSQQTTNQENDAYMDMEFPVNMKDTSLVSAEYIDMATGL